MIHHLRRHAQKVIHPNNLWKALLSLSGVCLILGVFLLLQTNNITSQNLNANFSSYTKKIVNSEQSVAGVEEAIYSFDYKKPCFTEISSNFINPDYFTFQNQQLEVQKTQLSSIKNDISQKNFSVEQKNDLNQKLTTLDQKIAKSETTLKNQNQSIEKYLNLQKQASKICANLSPTTDESKMQLITESLDFLEDKTLNSNWVSNYQNWLESGDLTQNKTFEAIFKFPKF
jgi:hypothetical protein